MKVKIIPYITRRKDLTFYYCEFTDSFLVRSQCIFSKELFEVKLIIFKCNTFFLQRIKQN